MSRLLVVGLVGMMMLGAGMNVVAAAAERAVPEREMTARGGLPHVAAKLREGKTVTVAYIGGSITAANGWRPATTAWLARQFPGAEVREVNAAVSGTGSMLGVFRFGQDVLAQRPDLVFIEFAVNDTGVPPIDIRRATEGMVRQAWRQDPAIDLCFVYTLQERFMADLNAGTFPPSASAMEAVAEHYAIPSVHLGHEVVKLVAAGKMLITAEKDDQPATEDAKAVFSHDGIHPLLETGHTIYADTLATAMQTLLTGQAAPHAVPAALETTNLESATIVPLDRATLSEGWSRVSPDHAIAKQIPRVAAGLWVGRGAGQTIRFRVRGGTTVGLYDLVAPESGILTVSIDGGAPKPLDRFNNFSIHYRLKGILLADNVAPGEHEVLVTISADPVDKRGLLAKRKIEWGPEQEHQYPGPAHYVAGIMTDGELLPP